MFKPVFYMKQTEGDMCVACSINLVCTFECTRKKEKNRNQCFNMVRSIYCISTCDWYRRVVNMEDFNACISICRQDLFFRILLNGKHLMYHLSMSVKEEFCLDEIGWRGDIATIGVVNVLASHNCIAKDKIDLNCNKRRIISYRVNLLANWLDDHKRRVS